MMDGAASPVSVVECLPRRDHWNAFAALCRGSFLCLLEASRPMRLFGRQAFVEFHAELDGTRCKIGQAALVRRGGAWIIRDRLQLLPEAAVLLPACLQATMRHFGPGRYRYGSQWNWEPVNPALSRMHGSSAAIRECTVEAIDLAGWPGFDDYYRSVSSNIRRNDARCRRLGAEVELQSVRGLAAIKALPHLLRVRWHVMRHKVGRPWHLALDMLRTIVQMLLFRRSVVLLLGRHRGRTLSVFFGIQQGDILHYVSGGTLPNRIGIGPHLFMQTIRFWYQHHPRGLLVMGVSDGEPPATHTAGHLLFRRKLRVVSQRTAILEIKYRPPYAASPTRPWLSSTAQPCTDGEAVPQPNRWK